jgi:hypothetical protein
MLQFQRREEAFHRRIVLTISGTIHAADDVLPFTLVKVPRHLLAQLPSVHTCRERIECFIDEFVKRKLHSIGSVPQKTTM